MAISSFGGIVVGSEPARADDDWFESVRQNCERVRAGYFCRDSARRGRRSRRDVYERSRGSIFNRRDDTFSSRQVRSGRIYEGAVIATRADDNGSFRLRRGESRSLTLVVDRDVRSDTDRYILIPRGSRILGRLRPHDGGVRYEADDIILANGRRYDFDARSETLYASRSRGRRLSSSAAGVILGSVLGDRRVGDVVRDRDILSRSRSQDYITINPRRDLDLRLTNDFRVRN
ncbi:MAG: hypothetical protein AAGB01_07685 [Cyanobacteria bacterium P01_F01_bin.42]